MEKKVARGSRQGTWCFTWATPATFSGVLLGGLKKGTLGFGFEWAIGSLRVRRYGHGGFTVQNFKALDSGTW